MLDDNEFDMPVGALGDDEDEDEDGEEDAPPAGLDGDEDEGGMMQ